jgi:hypothetical protein
MRMTTAQVNSRASNLVSSGFFLFCVTRSIYIVHQTRRNVSRLLFIESLGYSSLFVTMQCSREEEKRPLREE